MVIRSWTLYAIVLVIAAAWLPLSARIDDIGAITGKDIIVTGALNAGGFITTEKKALISGLRVETEAGDEGFVGYTEKGVSIVQPGALVRIVIFGWWLDEVLYFGFTHTENCSDTLANVNQGDFTIQTEKRVVIEYVFEASHDLYKICMKQKPRETANGEQFEMPYMLIEDIRSSVSTDMPPRQYYFPMPVQITIIAFLLVLSGLFSGLNLGLMALTPQELHLISKSGSEQERKYAETILPVRKSGNLLLCSLLLGNVCVNSAISILFGDLTSGTVALIISSAGIVVFGEIFPQALCVKKGLAVGAYTIWITRLFLVLTCPLSYPISKILDCVLGDEVVSYDRKRLMELIKLSTRNEEGLAEELKIAVGAMEISDKTVSDVMTKVNDVFMLPSTTILNTKAVAEILRMGYTRIPVFEGNRNTIVSLLFVKDLALLDPDDNFTIKTVCGYHEHALRFVLEDTPLRVMLEEFKKGEYHLAIVQRIVEKSDSDPVYEVVGLVTLEDIVEEILQAEIVDETDAITDNVTRIRRRRARDDFTHLLSNENSSFQISMQMQFVTMQWLTANVPAFTAQYVNRNILEKIIRQNVRKVEFSHLNATDGKMVLPRQKIYKKKEPSDKFILILEGRMVVTIGQNEMNFEAGPWHSFGTEILDRIMSSIESGNKNFATGGPPVQAPPQTPQGQQAQAQPPLTPSSAPSSAASSILRRHSSVRASQGAILPVSSGSNADDKKITFIPDFSVNIQEDCTYLEVTAQTYLLAYRTTLLSRGGKHDEHYSSAGDLGPSNLANELIKEEDDGASQTQSNGRPKHKRSASDYNSPDMSSSPPLVKPENTERTDSDSYSDTETSPLTKGSP